MVIQNTKMFRQAQHDNVGCKKMMGIIPDCPSPDKGSFLVLGNLHLFYPSLSFLTKIHGHPSSTVVSVLLLISDQYHSFLI